MEAVRSPKTSVTSYNVTPRGSHILQRFQLHNGESKMTCDEVCFL
jgi:hypothetical protein